MISVSFFSWTKTPLMLFFWFVLALTLLSSAYAEAPVPIIFIPGIGGDANSWEAFGDVLGQNGWIFGGCPSFDRITDRIQSICSVSLSEGHFYRMQFSDNQNLTFIDQAEELGLVIEAVLAVNPGKAKVILVGHSMGGLAARSYLQLISTTENILKLITVGTPHLGAQLAVVAQEACQDAISSVICDLFSIVLQIDPFSVAMTELRPDSLALLTLNDLMSHPLPDNVEYTSILGVGTPVVDLDGQDGDGVVTAYSQNLGNVPGASSLRNISISITVDDRASCDRGFTPDPIFGEDINPLPNQTHTCETNDTSVLIELLKQIRPSDASPTIASVVPNILQAMPMGQRQLLTINGIGFLPTSTLIFNEGTQDYASQPEQLRFINALKLEYDIAVGPDPANWTVKVVNDTLESNAYPFTVLAMIPAPVITTINPNTVTGSNSLQTVTLSGSNFVNGLTVTLRDVTNNQIYPERPFVLVGSTHVEITPVFGTDAVTWTAQIINPDGKASNQESFDVIAPVPVINSLDPDTATAGASDFILTVNGSTFASSSVVQWNGTNRSTTPVKTPGGLVTALQATIPASDIAVEGMAAVRVFTPAPGGGLSNTMTFSITVEPTAPTITTSSPLPQGTIGMAYSQTLQATGGTLPYTWTLAAGTLPGGLSLSNAGVISGTPTEAGHVTFTARVTGSDGLNSTKSFILILNVEQQTGSIRVSIVPQEAVAAGAQWKLTSESSWHNSGTIKSGLPFGTYMVAFKSIPGWSTPGNQEVIISAQNPDIWINSDSYVRQFIPAPTNLQTLANASDAITLTWEDNSPSEDFFVIEWRIGTTSDFSQRITVEANTTSWTDDGFGNGLRGGATYCYRVKALATLSEPLGSSDYSNEDCATLSAGILSVTPRQGLTFSGNEGGPFTASANAIAIENIGNSPLSWTAEHDASWLRLDPTVGDVAAGSRASVPVALTTEANVIPPGTYRDTITITAPGAVDSPQQLPVTLSISALSAGWSIETVDIAVPGVFWFSDPSIALDASDKAHITYTSCISTDCDLKYATNQSGSWDINLFERPLYQVDGAIALDSDNNVHIIFYEFGNPEPDVAIRYMTNKSGTWVQSAIENRAGIHPSIAIDSHDHVHVSYIADNRLTYAHNISGSWTITTIDTTTNYPRFTSIALDSNDKVHISYIDDINDDLMYATNGSGTWGIFTIDSNFVGSYTSIALDSQDRVHISYYNNWDRDLKYATNSSGSWTTATIDSEGEVGLYNAMALDNNDNVHICYFDNTNLDLKYATNASGTWTTSAVDKTGNVGYDCSIALDSGHLAHMSYRDSNSALKYAQQLPDTRDITAPTRVQVTAPGDGQVLAGTVAVQGTASDDSGTIVKMEFFFGGSSMPQCTDTTPKPSGSLFLCHVDTETLADGAWLVYARAFDPAGNAAESPQVAVTISNADVTPPVAVPVTPSPQFDVFVGVPFDVTTVFTERESAVTSCKYTIDGTTWFHADLTESSPTFTCTKTGILGADGLRLTLNMGATSSGGTGTGTAISRTVDAAAPTTTDDASTGWSGSDLTVTLRANDAGAGVARTEYCTDTTNSCTPATSGTVVPVTCAAGAVCQIHVHYRSVDNVGNTEAVQHALVQIDKAGPAAVTDLAPTSASATTVTLTWSLPTDNGSGLAAFDVRYREGTSFTEDDWATSQQVAVEPTPPATGMTITDLTCDMTYIFALKTSDAMGNVSAMSNTASRTTTVCEDSSPPEPNPMTWAAAPQAQSTNAITMTATAATDASLPIQYAFTCASGGSGCDDSGWQADTAYTDGGLSPNTQYGYQVEARDSAPTPNETGWSPVVSVYTHIETPTGIEVGEVTASSMELCASGTLSHLTAGSSGVYFACANDGSGCDDSGWQTSRCYTNTGLSANTPYSYQVKARNGDGMETAYVPPTPSSTCTLAVSPAAPTVSNPTATSLDVDPNPNGNPAATEMALYNETDGYYVDASGGNHGATPVWQTDAQWDTVTMRDLTPDTTYEFSVKARNCEGEETDLGLVGSGTTTSTNGLQGQYFDNPDLTHLTLTRIDPTLDFDWGLGTPDVLIDPDTFSVRWMGKVQTDVSELYTFEINTDDGVRLWLDGQLVIDYWQLGGVSYHSDVDLTAGLHDLKLEFFEDTGEAFLHVYWSSASTPYAIIPQDHLFPPEAEGAAPVLSWTGEPNYLTDGLHPETGDADQIFTYRIRYRDDDGDVPMTGYPRLHILQGDREIDGSPVAMSLASGTEADGIYTYSTTLPLSTAYRYYFDAKDVTGLQAVATPIVATPTVPVNAPRLTTHLSVSINGSGTVRSDTGEIDCLPDCDADYPFEESPSPVILIAEADDGWSFDHWKGACEGPDNPCRLTMDANKETTAVFRPCPAKAALEAALDKQSILTVLYAFRDTVLAQTPAGRRAIELFYHHSAEGAWLMFRHPELRARTRQLLERLLPTLQAAVDGRPATMPAADVAAITDLLEAVAPLASPELQKTVVQLQTDLRNGQLLTGLGIEVYDQ